MAQSGFGKAVVNDAWDARYPFGTDLEGRFLYVREADRQWLLATFDFSYMFRRTSLAWREAVSSDTGIPADHIWVHELQNHSAPIALELDGEPCQNLIEVSLPVIRKVMAGAEEAELGYVIADLGDRFNMNRSDLAGTIAFDDAEMLKTPWVFAHTYYGFKVTDTEALALGRYLMAGGVFFADAFPPATETLGPLDTSFRQFYKSALGTQGMRFRQDWHFERLPDGHPMYHCLFDFEGAPIGYNISNEILNLGGYIEGITLDGRLLGLMSNECYLRAWSHYGPGGFKPATKGYEWVRELDNTRQLQLGVNTIIFALTQEGSITHRIMDSLSY